MDPYQLAREGIVVTGAIPQEYSDVLSLPVLRFIAQIARCFEPTRQQLLQKREIKQRSLRKGHFPRFQDSTKNIRSQEWKIEPVPPALLERKVDVVCLNAADPQTLWACMDSDANGIQVDFDDGYSPTWLNGLRAQANLIKAVRNNLLVNGKAPKNKALLITRPRSLNLNESHILIDGQPLAGAFFDFGVFWYHNSVLLSKSGRGPFFYLPKLESSEESKLWDDIFEYSQNKMNIPIGTTKAIVLIENIMASFEMEEILYSLRRHSAGLNAGRWDYIFSFIKKFSHNEDFVLHERPKLGLDQPFLSNYYKLLVDTCHRRGAHATGGMAPQVPLDLKDKVLVAKLFQQVKDGKEAEAKLGCDGALVAAPCMVKACREVFDTYIGNKPNNIHGPKEQFSVKSEELLKISKPNGVKVSSNGVKSATRVVVIYIFNWLRGTGAVVLDNIVEDIATCEISRSLLWQWIHYAIVTEEGQPINRLLVDSFIKEIITEELKASGKLDSEKELYRAGYLTLATVTGLNFLDFLPSLLYPFLIDHNNIAKL